MSEESEVEKLRKRVENLETKLEDVKARCVLKEPETPIEEMPEEAGETGAAESPESEAEATESYPEE